MKTRSRTSAQRTSSAKLLTLLTAILAFVCVAPPAASQETGSVVVRNATVLTVTDGTLQDTDVLVLDGKITEIGADLPTRRGVREIDAEGKFVMPGIVDAHSHTALSSVNESTSPVTAEVSTEDVVDPFDISLYRALAGGVTTSHVMHGSANVIGGQNETIKHRYGEMSPDALRMAGAPRTIKFALGENPTRVHGERSIQPATRMGVEMVLRRTFSDAKAYMEKWDRYNAQPDRRGSDGDRLQPPEIDLRMEAIADVIRGDVLVHCHSYRADEILMLMRVLKDFGVDRITFQHANEGYKVAPELAEFGAYASVFADWWAYKFEVYYSTAYNAAILTRNGVRTSINSDSEELNRHLYHEAAKTQKYGDLTDDEAIALITINPAMQLGINERVGSIEVGKDGDLAIFSAHPLSVYAVAEATIVDGIVRFDRKNDPDDMRLIVDPERSIETTVLDVDHHRCLQDADFVFAGQ